MKNRLLSSCIARMAFAGLVIGTSTGFAAPVTPLSIDVQTAAQVAALNGSGATYGKAKAVFPDGPLTVTSDTSAELSGGTSAELSGGTSAESSRGPGAWSADTVQLVLSGNSASLGAGTISLTFGGLTPVKFTASNFFTTMAGGFPDRISEIGDGAVNGIKFPEADHAVADITFSGTLTKKADLGSLTITSPINLRVDVFCAPVPEPDPTAFYGIGAIGLLGVMVVRHRRHHCTGA